MRATVKEISTGVCQVTSRTDYYAFGGPMPGRTYNLSSYLYNYQGQENVTGTNWQNFELRMHNSDLGRWMAPDPAGQFYSPYISMGNNPVSGVDPDGGYANFDKVNPYGNVLKNYTNPLSGAEQMALAAQGYEDELARIDLLMSKGYYSAAELEEALNNANRQYGALRWAIANEGGFEARLSSERRRYTTDDGHISAYDIANAEFEGRATSAMAEAIMMSSYGRGNLMLDDNYYVASEGGWGYYEATWEKDPLGLSKTIVNNEKSILSIAFNRIGRIQNKETAGKGGYDWGYVGNVLGTGGVAYAGLENAVANKYWWMSAKGVYNSTKILEQGANGKYVRGVQGFRNGYNSALRAASGYKVAGNIVGGLGLVVTGVQLYNNQITATEASVDAFFGVVGFFGPIGAGVSAVYFLGKLGYEYYSGNTLFEKPKQ